MAHESALMEVVVLQTSSSVALDSKVHDSEQLKPVLHHVEPILSKGLEALPIPVLCVTLRAIFICTNSMVWGQ
ncbi:hypothetical protein L484_020751 [Morus notabilis]|uniref:Uncharacterized protein n=1 Tax=Morus notabilis TaxID=981085 RepID=W9RUX8_9ROSA|nr:hypothetical protein L484_020751 [Morus notabilis]